MGIEILKIKRENDLIPLTLSEDIIEELLKNKGQGIFNGYRTYNVIDSVISGSNAENAGLLSGDSIVEINGLKHPTLKDFREEIQKYKSEEIEISFYRNNSYNTLSVLTNAEC